MNQKIQDLETRILFMNHQQQMSQLLLEERQRLVEQLQKELIEIKAERDRLIQLLEKQRLEQPQWIEAKTVKFATPEVTRPSETLESHPPHDPTVKTKTVESQPAQSFLEVALIDKM